MHVCLRYHVNKYLQRILRVLASAPRPAAVGITCLLGAAACSPTLTSQGSIGGPETVKTPPTTASEADSSITVERFIVDSSDHALVVIYNVASGDSGLRASDTVTYFARGHAVVRSSRAPPGPLTQSRLFRYVADGRVAEIKVAQNCALHRVATRQFPGETFGCWMPTVAFPLPIHPYIAAAISDSAGLESAYDSTMLLMNHEIFGDRMQPVPTWRDATQTPTKSSSDDRSDLRHPTFLRAAQPIAKSACRSSVPERTT